MIEKFEDLDLKPEDKDEDIDVKVQEKLGTSLSNITNALSAYVQESAGDIADKCQNHVLILDWEDNQEYNSCMDNAEEIAQFLRKECFKPEHWRLSYISLVKSNLIDFIYYCNIVDSENALCGHVLVSFAGRIKHVFVQSE